MDETVNRRSFLGVAGLAATSASRVLGANDRIRVGAIGVGVRSRLVLGGFLQQSMVDVTALCDVWSQQIDQTKTELPRTAAAKEYGDYRKMIASEKLDAVLVTTPDHWHATIAIEAMNAGLDVYVEKPLMLNLEEGPRVVKAARVNRRICQVGTQARSARHNIQLKQEIFDTGKLGKITLVRTWYNGNTYHVRKAPESLQKQPDNLDWARFLGPVKWREWDPQQYWSWRAYLDFGGGQIGDLYVHQVDLAHFLMGIDDPVSAVAAGGVLHYKDGRTAPDNIALAVQYVNGCVITYEGSVVPGARGRGLLFFGTEGGLRIDSDLPDGPVFLPPGRGKPVPVASGSGGDSTADHVKNFLECMRSRKLPAADVYIGHRSSQAALLGKVAYLEQRRVKFDPVREETLPVADGRLRSRAENA